MKVSFEFDPKTKKITNLLIQDQPEINIALPTIRIEDNKLIFSKSAIELIGVKVGERIAINYWTVNNQETFPVIGKSSVFGDSDNGLKLTKSNTIAFRGQNRTSLLMYGSIFLIESFKDNMFKLVKLEQEKIDLKEDDSVLSNIEEHNAELEEEINSIIDENNNDLSF